LCIEEQERITVDRIENGIYLREARRLRRSSETRPENRSGQRNRWFDQSLRNRVTSLDVKVLHLHSIREQLTLLTLRTGFRYVVEICSICCFSRPRFAGCEIKIAGMTNNHVG